MKSMFNPVRGNGRYDLPTAFLTETKSGKWVYRIRLNVDEILARLEAGESIMAVDVPTKADGTINIHGNNNGKRWKGFKYYAWAIKKQPVQPC